MVRNRGGAKTLLRTRSHPCSRTGIHALVSHDSRTSAAKGSRFTMSHSSDFHADAEWVRTQDDGDPLRGFRSEFLVPPHAGGDQTYLVGNSLGLQPRGVRQALLDELDDWARLGVEGHLHARHPWLPYHAEVRAGLAEVVGAKPIEVVAMNSLTNS